MIYSLALKRRWFVQDLLEGRLCHFQKNTVQKQFITWLLNPSKEIQLLQLHKELLDIFIAKGIFLRASNFCIESKSSFIILLNDRSVSCSSKAEVRSNEIVSISFLLKFNIAIFFLKLNKFSGMYVIKLFERSKIFSLGRNLNKSDDPWFFNIPPRRFLDKFSKESIFKFRNDSLVIFEQKLFDRSACCKCCSPDKTKLGI